MTGRLHFSRAEPETGVREEGVCMPGITVGQGVQGRACTQGFTVPVPVTGKPRQKSRARL